MSFSHPEPERLKAFGLGRLPTAEAAPIEEHVAGCDTCCRALATLADDRLLSLLRPCPETAWWPGTPSSQPAQRPFVAPRELADHPRYRLLDILGEGGMGTVYKAEHRLMNRLVAIKVVRDALLEKPAVKERFLRELRTAARLAHPNLVAAHDAEQAGDSCFLVMEYVPGESLADVVKRNGPLPEAKACAYVRQAALGLQYVHERGLVHRDVKPGNLMLTPEGVIKVLDFGLARFTLEQAAEQTAAGALLGTPAFMAPEQARNARGADCRADVYSLGATLYYLLSGKPPPGSDGLGLPVSAALGQVLERMLATDPAARIQTAAEVASALAPFAAPDIAATKQMPSGRKRPFSGGALVAGLVAIGGLLFCLGYLFQSGGKKPAERNRGQEPKETIPEAKGPGAVFKQETTVSKEESQKRTFLSVVPKSISPQKPREVRRWLGHSQKVASLALVPALRRFVTGSFGELYLWDLDQDPEVWHSKPFEVGGWLYGVALSPDGSTALAGGQDRSVHLWDMTKGTRVGKLDTGISPIQSLALAPDRQHFVFATQAGTGRLCTVKPLKEITRFIGNPVAFAGDGRTFVSGNERSLYIWDAQKPSTVELRRCPGPARRIGSLAVSHDGKRVLTGEDWNPDGQAFLWDLSGEKTTSLTGHKNVKAVALTPDGRLALTGDAAGVLRLWNATTGKLLHQWEGHDGPVSALAIMPDGRLALSGGEDKKVRLWTMAD